MTLIQVLYFSPPYLAQMLRKTSFKSMHCIFKVHVYYWWLKLKPSSSAGCYYALYLPVLTNYHLIGCYKSALLPVYPSALLKHAHGVICALLYYAQIMYIMSAWSEPLLSGLIQQTTNWWYFSYFSLTFHINCLQWNVKSCFLRKKEKFGNVCRKFWPEC